MLLIWIFILKFYFAFCQHGVILSIDTTGSAVYNGYLWNNNKIIFLSPELKATVVKGISKSEKICGFELRSQETKDIPFTVYLLDELSGLGEIRTNPFVNLGNQQRVEYELTVEAFDCDELPHYSRGAIVRIHVFNESGPVFYNKSYSFIVKKDAGVGVIVGTVKAKFLEGNSIEYSLQYNESPFEIDRFGKISVQKSLLGIKNSLFEVRVLAKEKLKLIEKQSMVFVNIEVQEICQNKLTDIPDQLDYHIKTGIVNMMDAGQLIQSGHKPVLTICHLPSPLREVTLKVSLTSKSMTEFNIGTKKHICQNDISSFRIQRGICGATVDTLKFTSLQGGTKKIKNKNSIGPEIIKGLGADFTVMWWMKRRTRLKANIFCLNDDQKSVTISLEDCNLLIDHPSEMVKIEMPAEMCRFNDWQFFAISQKWDTNPNLKIWIGGLLMTSVTTKMNLFQFSDVKLFLGRCSEDISVNHVTETSNRDSLLEIGVISVTKDKSQKPEVIQCLSSCGQALVTADSISTLPQVSVSRKGSSIYIRSSSITQLLDSPMKIHYINSFYTSKAEMIQTFDSLFISMDLEIECESKEIVTVPQAVMRINFIGPQKSISNDTLDIEIMSNATITASKLTGIRLFPNLRFVNANTENSSTKNFKIESCTIRLLQRNLVENEKIYLSDTWLAVLKTHKLEIRSNTYLWSIEGEADGTVYEDILKEILVNMIDERKKFSILCNLKGGDSTNQAIVEIIQLKADSIYYTIEENYQDLNHQSQSERRFLHEPDRSELFLSITKSKFVAVIIMAVLGGAACSLVTAAVTCFILRKRELSRTRKRANNMKTYSKNTLSSPNQPALVNTHGLFIEYEYEEDRNSMADIPDDEEQNLDNISCETCNMTDPEIILSSIKPMKEIPRSNTITFPIKHRKF